MDGTGKKKWLFSIGNGAEIRPLEKGRKSPAIKTYLVGTEKNHLCEKIKYWNAETDK